MYRVDYTLKYGAVSLSKGSVSARPPNGLAWREGRCGATPLRRAIGGANQRRGKLDPFTGIVDQILIDDQERPKKQQPHRDRLRDEDFTGGYRSSRTMFATRSSAGKRCSCWCGAIPRPTSVKLWWSLTAYSARRTTWWSICRIAKAFPAETTEAFCEGHNAAFRFGGVPRSILYDNTTLAGGEDSGRRQAQADQGVQ